jgi:hypothetical protein
MFPRRVFPWLIAGLLLVFFATGQSVPDRLNSLPILGPNDPRAFFFRIAESGAHVFMQAPKAAQQRITFDQWEKTFDRLMGMELKVLNEELPNDARRDVEWGLRFKKDHPDQVVLLHFNGDARDPRWEAGKFFAGHWIYHPGARILADVPAEDGETQIRVSDPGLFRTDTGRTRVSKDDIGLCELDATGKPDWSRSEQVSLISIDAAAGTIRVRRAQFGARARAFLAGRAYAAPHRTEGPWGAGANLMWCYNYSIDCPRDSRGQDCADVLAEDLAGRLLPGGTLAAFDGLEFDNILQTIKVRAGDRNADTNADGVADNGVIDGINKYGIGVTEFLRKLRARLGAGKIIQADGQDAENQRAFGILNGIEHEGFPHVLDHEMKDWSGALNRISYWRQNSYKPFFSYINHKFVLIDPKTHLFVRPDVPFRHHRLVFAAAMFTDSALGYLLMPEPEPGELVGVWDELDMGAEHRQAWLGKPLGPTVRMAERQTNLVHGDLRTQFAGADVDIAADGARIRLASRKHGPGATRFRFRGITSTGPDLFVKLVAHGQTIDGYPAEMARLMQVELTSTKQRFMTWVGTREFDSGFYFTGAPSGAADLEFSIEGTEPVWISQMAAFAHPDALYRRFEHGLVLGNPAHHPYTFAMDQLFSGRHYRRLKGSPHQDTVANSGAPVSGDVTLGPEDGLFLVDAAR